MNEIAENQKLFIHFECVTIPDLSNETNILYLDCSHNKIENLDNLPPNLEVLKCDNNKLTRLDNLPANLIYLNCSNNNLTNLDNFEGTKGSSALTGGKASPSSVPLPLAKNKGARGAEDPRGV